jgi:hypothetical protein
MKTYRLRSKSLASVFGAEPKMLNVHIMRLCVLFEDLRVEVLGATAEDEIKYLDLCSAEISGLHRFEYSVWGMRNRARSRAERIG